MITKKQIIATLRTMDTTEIYRLCWLVTGKRDPLDVYKFIVENSPTKMVYHNAWRISHPSRKNAVDDVYKGKHGYFEPLRRHYVRLQFQRELEQGYSSYTKVPMYGRTNLYGASPIYGHRDYNKWCCMPIKGNERYCELLLKKYGLRAYGVLETVDSNII